MTKRVVTDILAFGGAPVAFDEITHGHYRGVCPWCAQNLETVKATTFGELYELLYYVTANHMNSCTNKQVDSLPENMRVQIKPKGVVQ